ncbi:uncharacterized protein LOC121879036 [Homarus americanus]|uniref:Uncharacterized protein n=1 Tax=Homarus americanus TaxID=6706 RepID=A0A8J5MNS0_HOMAM|nr:uncharacterized protein LOC121879036 [Homarus americanus]KAG7158194.1 hypothetical protein Hamer_G008829 [Homarus americanus]
MVWVTRMGSLLMAVLWIANIVLDIMAIIDLIYKTVGDGIFLAICFIFLHVIINAWLVRVLFHGFNKLGLFFLFLTSQSTLFLLSRGAWHGLRACCVQSQREKTRRTLRAKFALVCEMRNSFEKLSVEGSEYSLRSCVLSQSEAVPADTSGAPVVLQPSNIICTVEQGTDVSVKMEKTKFIPNTKKIVLNLDAPPDIYGGEPSVYKYVIRKLQALFSDKMNLSYHIVTDSTNTKILHASCTDKRIGTLPDRIISENPHVICNDTHYVLNLSRINGYEVYNITKRSFVDITSFVNRDLTKLIWLPIWPVAAVKIFITLSFRAHMKGDSIPALIYASTVFGILTWMVTQRTLYHTNLDVFLLAGLKLFFYVTRTILVCGTSVITTLLYIPIIYLSAKAAGVVGFMGYLAYVKAARNIELFDDPVDIYTFYPMHNPSVQVAESIVYCIWAVCAYCTSSDSHASIGLAIMLITLIGHSIGLGWLWFMRSWRSQPLRDPAQVLTLIKQMEYVRM